MKYVEEVVLKEESFCNTDNRKLPKGKKIVRYLGPIKSLWGDYCDKECFEKLVEINKKNIYIISEEDLPKSQ